MGAEGFLGVRLFKEHSHPEPWLGHSKLKQKSRVYCKTTWRFVHTEVCVLLLVH